MICEKNHLIFTSWDLPRIFICLPCVDIRCTVPLITVKTSFYAGSRKFPMAADTVTSSVSLSSKGAMAGSYRTCEANVAGENSSFIFTVCVKSVPLYHLKLAYLVLHMAAKQFFEPTSKNGEISRLNWSLLIELFEISLIHYI